MHRARRERGGRIGLPRGGRRTTPSDCTRLRIGRSSSQPSWHLSSPSRQLSGWGTHGRSLRPLPASTDGIEVPTESWRDGGRLRRPVGDRLGDRARSRPRCISRWRPAGSSCRWQLLALLRSPCGRVCAYPSGRPLLPDAIETRSAPSEGHWQAAHRPSLRETSRTNAHLVEQAGVEPASCIHLLQRVRQAQSQHRYHHVHSLRATN
jgi:hypothetical protein